MIFEFIYVFLIRILESVLCTYRTILIVNRNKEKAFIIAFIEIAIWLLAMKTIIARDFDLFSTIAYALGFSLGTYVGVLITARFSKKNMCLVITNINTYDKLISKFKKYEPDYYKSGNKKYTVILKIQEKDLKEIKEKIYKIEQNAIIDSIDYKRV